MNDQISMKELIDPFTGEQEKGKIKTAPVGAANNNSVVARFFSILFRGRPQEISPYRARTNHPFNGWL